MVNFGNLSWYKKLFNKSQEKSEAKKLDVDKLKKIIFCLLIFVVVIIFVSSFKTKKIEKKKEVNTTLSAMEYCLTIENRLCNVLGKIKNIGDIEVFVMVDSSPTIKYLEETKTETTNKDQISTSSIETEIVLCKNGTITSPVVVVEIMPKITGILIVAAGAKDIKMKNTLINAVSAILNISVSNIEVLEGA